MRTIDWLWGSGDQLTIIQMSARTFVMFILLFILIRLGGMRIFGRKTAFDTIVIIMLGAIAARGIVGASPFWSTVVASVFLIVINRLFAILSERSIKINHLLQGKPLLLYEEGHIIWRNMRAASLSEIDLLESLRDKTHGETLTDIDKVYMETNGQLSFVKKNCA
jgi:uncharacterized membrane protein YcaP (DUF421 family)